MNDHDLLNDLYGLTFDEAAFLDSLATTPRTLHLVVFESSGAMRDAMASALGDQREHWDVRFVERADELRAAIAGGGVDVVLASADATASLPSLLSEVELRDPGALRVVLGDRIEDVGVLDASALAHRFVARPVDLPWLLDDLAAQVRRREVTSRSEALRLALGDTALPSSPSLWLALSKVVDDPEVGAAELAEIVEGNVAVTAKALQLANSAWFGLPRRVSRIEDAVVLLGSRALQALVLAAEVSASLGAEVDADWLAAFEQDATAVARAARVVAPPALRQDAVAAALLHDVGTLLLMRHHPEVMRVAVTMPLAQRLQLETDLVGATHAEVGALLLAAWGLPDSLVDGVLAHHSPWAGVRGELDLAGIVHVADALVRDRATVADVGLPYLDRLEAHAWLEVWMDALA